MFTSFGFTSQLVNVIHPGDTHVPIESQYFLASRHDIDDFEDALKKDSLFQPVRKKLLNIGNFNKSAWIKIELINTSSQEEFKFEFKGMYADSLRYLIVKSGQVIKEYPKKGLCFPQNNTREYLVSKPSYFYDLTLPTGDSVDVYIHCIVNNGHFTSSQTIWTPSGFELRKRNIRVKTTFLLLCGGFALLVLIVALTFYLFTKDQIHLYYIGFILANVGNLMLIANFFSVKIIERNLFFGQNYSDVFGLLQIIFGLQYTIHFLKLRQETPRVYNFLKVIVWSTVVTAFFTLFLRSFDIVLEITFYVIKIKLIFVTFFSIGLGIYLIIKKNLMARYFVVAYLPLLYFVTHYFLMIFNFTENARSISWEFVIFVEILVLTIAMAHRYYLIGKKSIEYQKTINRQQKEQIQEIISAQEKERGRIARELHDGVMQEIGSVIMRLRAFSGKSKTHENEEIRLIEESLENSNRYLRNVSHQMMPRALEELGIVPATKQMIESAFKYTAIEHSFESFNIDNRPTKEIEVTIYRIIQELINNVIKHSQAKKVVVQIYQVAESLMIIFEDDGIGFDKSKLNEGMGLRNIKSRLELVLGCIEHQSSPHLGTLVTIRVPNKG